MQGEGWIGLRSFEAGSTNLARDWRWVENANEKVACVDYIPPDSTFDDRKGKDCIVQADATGQWINVDCKKKLPTFCEFLPGE